MTTDLIVDTSDATFVHDVLERSKGIPVVVDFWAPWCGPCRVLSPILEKLAEEHRGEVQFGALNTDENPRVATQLKIEGIPAVFAFVNGQPVDKFVGALPEPSVREFIQKLVPSDSDRKVRAAMTLLREGKPDEARQLFEAVLSAEPNNRAATVGLAALLTETVELDRAAEMASKWPGEAAAKQVMAHIRIRRASANIDRATMEQRLAANPDDVEAHYRLGALLASQREWEPGLEHLLIAVSLDRKLEGEGPRLRMLDVFNMLGDGNTLTQEYRRRLGHMMF